MILGKAFQKRIKELVNNPDFARPISALTKDHSKQGNVKLITKIKASA
jgi:hypothetical protein